MMRRNGATRQSEITREANNQESLVDIESLNKSISSEKRSINSGSAGSDSQTNAASATREKLRARFPAIDDPQPCIFRVPEKQRSKHEDAYTPWVVSVGPYHREMEQTRAMERHKLRYLQSFLTGNHNEKKLEDYMEVVKVLEGKARCCYDKLPEKMGSQEFIEMLVVDGIFIIQLFILHHEKNSETVVTDDRSINNQWLLADVRRDLALLENQLPLFVLERLYDMAFGGSHSPNLTELAYEFFRPITKSNHIIPITSGGRHLLDAIRDCYLPSPETKKELEQLREVDAEKLSQYLHFCTANTLEASEIVRFQKSEGNFLDIKMGNGVIEIPPFILSPLFETVLRNVIVFEQNCCQDNAYIIEYVSFLCKLISTPEDAKVLTGKGIIENWLGNYEMAVNFFQSFHVETILNTRKFHLFKLLVILDQSTARSRFKLWKMRLITDYFPNVWAIFSLVWMMFLLYLTMIQTVCSILSVPGWRKT